MIVMENFNETKGLITKSLIRQKKKNYERSNYFFFENLKRFFKKIVCLFSLPWLD